MTFEATQFRSDTGRLVFGSLYDQVTEDYEGKPLPPEKYFYQFGLAVAKNPGETHWATSPLGAVVWAQGHKDHPQMAQRPDFSWKAQDGDSTIPNKKGNKNCDKEGFPGHWVYTFRTSYPPKVVNADGSAYILEKNAVKAGDYVQIAGSVVGNTGATPGVYLNGNVVSLQGLGKAIVSGPDPKTLGFGGGPKPVGMMPVGTPTAAVGGPPPPAGQPAPPAPGAAYNPPPPPAAQQQVPQVPVTPSPGFVSPPVPGAGVAPPPPAGAAPPAPPSGPQMTAKAAGMTYPAFIAAGWTDATLRANGYMV
jgi:hypothetical protein